jgi:predicted nucleotidyltransferase
MDGLPTGDMLRVARLHGATAVPVFGSWARGEQGERSDLDLLVDLEAGRSLLDLVAIKQDLEHLLPCSVDVVTERSLSPWLRERMSQHDQRTYLEHIRAEADG